MKGLMALSLLLGFLFRFVELGSFFQSSDNAELPSKILHHHGYAWMTREYYGVLISLWVKIFTALVSSLGIHVNEFWWKAPVALAGTL